MTGPNSRSFGIDYRSTLAEIIARNTDIPADELNDNVFLVAEEDPAPSDGGSTPAGGGAPIIPSALVGVVGPEAVSARRR